MSIDFSLPLVLADLRDRTAAFIRDVVIPHEGEDRGEHGIDPDLRARLQREAKAAGIFAPHVSEEFGGLGLDVRGQSVVFEAAGYSLLGPQALNCAAPDEGNMHLLEVMATEEQKKRYLAPLAAGEIRSCFAMTEPAPGAGSNPTMLQTTARRGDGGWVINGRKWFATGAAPEQPSLSVWPAPANASPARRAAPCFLSTPTTLGSGYCASWTPWTEGSPAATRRPSSGTASSLRRCLG